MKIFGLKILGIMCFAFCFSCTGDRLKSTEQTDSLEYYKMAFEYIRKSEELLKYANQYGISKVKKNLCVSSGLEKPIRGHFIKDYVDHYFQKYSDSVKNAKRDSLLRLPTEYSYGRHIIRNYGVGNLAPKSECSLEIFFQQFKENYLVASVYVVKKYESDVFSFDNVVNTSLSYFFIIENERIVKVFVYELTS